jgi:hypothetical protein
MEEVFESTVTVAPKLEVKNIYKKNDEYVERKQ